MTVIKDMSEDAKVYFEIKKKYGEVTPENAHKEARKKNHPWHNRIEWDMEKAAYQYQIDQLRNIISKIEVTVITTERSYTVPLAVRNPRKQSNEQGYTDIVELNKEPMDARMVIIKELQMARVYLERARGYALALGQEQEIERFIESLIKLSTKFQKAS